MMGRLLMLALAVCWCSAAPTTDLVVPENLDLTGFSKLAPTAFLQADSADFNHRAKALETIALVNAQGGGTKDCEAAATELKASVNAAVATNNKDLGDLSTGSECPERGQADVKACGIKLQAAEEDASAAGDAVQAALDAPQTLGLEALMKCMSTDVCPQIDAAKATLASEKETQVQKDAAVVAIKEECDDFKASAAQQMFECQCAAKTTYDKVWKTATNGATERDTSWRTSEQLMCVLNKDATCETSPTPTVEAIKLAAGVADAVCPEFTPAEMEEAEQFLKDKGINLPGTLSDAVVFRLCIRSYSMFACSSSVPKGGTSRTQTMKSWGSHAGHVSSTSLSKLSKSRASITERSVSVVKSAPRVPLQLLLRRIVMGHGTSLGDFTPRHTLLITRTPILGITNVHHALLAPSRRETKEAQVGIPPTVPRVSATLAPLE